LGFAALTPTYRRTGRARTSAPGRDRGQVSNPKYATVLHDLQWSELKFEPVTLPGGVTEKASMVLILLT